MSTLSFAIPHAFGRRSVREHTSRQDRNLAPSSWPYGISGRITAYPWEGLSLIETETDWSSEISGLSE